MHAEIKVLEPCTCSIKVTVPRGNVTETPMILKATTCSHLSVFHVYFDRVHLLNDELEISFISNCLVKAVCLTQSILDKR